MNHTGFVYEPLETAQRHVRLLQIHAPPTQDMRDVPIRCSLRAYRHDECPPYLALSYAWSKVGPDAVISINNQDFHVSQTIRQALTELRHACFAHPARLPLPLGVAGSQDASRRTRQNQQQGGDLYVWVDQICINQSDNPEKSDQVLQMRHIYANADTAVAWLGPAANDSDMLLAFTRSVYETIDQEKWNVLWDLCENYERVEKLGRAFAAFCSRPYWTRLWVMQEFAMAPQLSVLCGESIISAECMLSALDVWYTLDDTPKGPSNIAKDKLLKRLDTIFHPPTRSFMDSVMTRRQRYRSGLGGSEYRGDAFFQVLVVCLVLEEDYNFPQASDPRDRVFALLHLAKDAGHFQPILDYSKACEQVYRETAVKLLQQGNVDMLTYCQFPKRLTGLPSWVPDWSMEVKNPPSEHAWADRKFHATGPKSLEANKNQLRRLSTMDLSTAELELHGRPVDLVREVGSLWDPDWTLPLDRDKAFDFIQDVFRLCKKSQRCRANEELLEALRTVTCDGTHYWFRDGPEDMQGAKLADYLRHYIEAYEYSFQVNIEQQAAAAASHKGREVGQVQEENGEEGEGERNANNSSVSSSVRNMEPQEDSEDGSWFTDAMKCLLARRSFLTTSGYVGLGPSHVGPGDEVCLFYGGAVPYMVRPQGNDRFELVGEAYVHGIMYGEALRGDSEDKAYTVV